MTAPLWAGLLLLAFGAVAILRVRLTRQQQIAALVLAAAAGLVVLRQFALAIPVAILGLGLWRRGGPIPQPDDTSEVETPALRMTLDHASGRMDGEILTGRFAGARLSGPAIIHQPDTTVLVPTSHSGEVDRFGNLMLRRTD